MTTEYKMTFNNITANQHITKQQHDITTHDKQHKI